MLIRKNITFILLTLILLLNSAYSGQELRYFDQVEPVSDEIRVAIFDGSSTSFKTLLKLKEEGIFSHGNLKFISVFHENEREAHQKSIALVKEIGINWFRFHMVSGSLKHTNLFQENELSTEFKQIFEKADGIILFGGADIPPNVYGKKTSLLTNIRAPYRHFLEVSLVFHLLGGHQNPDSTSLLAAAPGYPVMGICLGAQSLNVGTGGTMIQDIPSEIYGKTYVEEVLSISNDKWHENPWFLLYPEKSLFSGNMHPIQLLEKTIFTKEFGFSPEDKPYVLSIHHQALEKLGKGMKIIATSLDGKVVEAIAHDTFPHVLGVQFHPESSNIWNTEKRFKFSPEDETDVRLIDLLNDHPPSLTFHKNIWDWFSSKLKQFHRIKTGTSKHPDP